MFPLSVLGAERGEVSGRFRVDANRGTKPEAVGHSCRNAADDLFSAMQCRSMPTDECRLSHAASPW
jgi:hypothetical protein